MSLNDINIALIPKVDNPLTMKDMWPISLCNVLYKILAKVLANRLKKVLPKCISEEQSTFVEVEIFWTMSWLCLKLFII